MTMHDDPPGGEGLDAEHELVRGTAISMRKWTREEPGDWKPESVRPYEVVGYVLEGRAELRVGGDVRTLAPGEAYHVPAGTAHSYHILAPFTAIEALTR